MDVKLSEKAIKCNFVNFNQMGFKFAEKNWYFGKHKRNYVILIGCWLLLIKSWLTLIFKGFEDSSLSNNLFEMSVGVANIVFLMKLHLFLWNHKKINDLNEMLIHDLMVIDEKDKRLQKKQKLCIKVAKWVYRSYMISGLSWTAYFYYSGFHFKFHSFCYNDDDVPLLVVIMEEVFELIYFLILTGLTVDLQTIPITAMILLSSKLNLLGDEFAKLEYHSEKQFNETIGKLINYHGYILKLKQLFKNAYTVPLFLELLVLSLLLATLTYQFSLVSFLEKTYESLILFIAISLYLTQIWLPCYFGNVVASASDDLLFNLYNCPWYAMPIKARKMIIIIMINSQKTMNFGIGEFFRLDMEQFSKVSI
ncbi:unnamed protein product [Diamesa serratosioi]